VKETFQYRLGNEMQSNNRMTGYKDLVKSIAVASKGLTKQKKESTWFECCQTKLQPMQERKRKILREVMRSHNKADAERLREAQRAVKKCVKDAKASFVMQKAQVIQGKVKSGALKGISSDIESVKHAVNGQVPRRPGHDINDMHGIL